MRFIEGLLTARSHLAFLAGLGIALSIVSAVEASQPRRCEPGVTVAP